MSEKIVTQQLKEENNKLNENENKNEKLKKIKQLKMLTLKN